MSYCRFSSDGFNCDVYVYEDCAGGWTTHVAANRGEKGPIDLEYAGSRFNHPTALLCATNLEKLKEMGYLVPQYAIDNLKEENAS